MPTYTPASTVLFAVNTPHHIAVDRCGNAWLSNNGGLSNSLGAPASMLELAPNGSVLMNPVSTFAASTRGGYKLLPYIYSHQRLVTETGVGIVRPLFWAFPNDPNVVDDSNAWMLAGSALPPWDAAALSLNRLYETFLQPACRGGWHDRISTDGTLLVRHMPASSLSHIVCAFSELESQAAVRDP